MDFVNSKPCLGSKPAIRAKQTWRICWPIACGERWLYVEVPHEQWIKVAMDTHERRRRKRLAMLDVNIVEDILRHWDPIAPGECNPRDEYDSYATHIVSLVREAPDAARLADHLGRLQLESMGVGETPSRNLEVARQIVEALASGGSASPS